MFDTDNGDECTLQLHLQTKMTHLWHKRIPVYPFAACLAAGLPARLPARPPVCPPAPPSAGLPVGLPAGLLACSPPFTITAENFSRILLKSHRWEFTSHFLRGRNPSSSPKAPDNQEKARKLHSFLTRFSQVFEERKHLSLLFCFSPPRKKLLKS